MEKEGLRQFLNYLLERDVSINTIATDRHKGVGAIMKQTIPTSLINMMYGIWPRVL